jgi:O-antigen/teichoic acid export membrane protein
MISKGFLKSSIVFTLGGALPMLAGIILLPFYTNYLSDKLYTQLLFFISISLLFQILFSFSTESYFGVQYSQLANREVKQKKFTGTVSILLLGIGVILLFFSALFGNALFKLVYNPLLEIEFWPYGFFSVLTAFFNAYFKTSTVCLIYLKKPVTFLSVNLVNFFITLLISIGGLFLFPDSLVGPMFGRLVSGAVIFLLGHYVFYKNGIYVFEKEFLSDLVKFCAPYVLFVLSGWVLGQVDRYFLQTGISKADLNAYDLLLKCFFGIEFLQNSLSAVIFPKLFEIWNKTKNNQTSPESNRYFNVFTVVNIVQLILFCVFVPIIYNVIISNTSFYTSKNYIGILAAGYALRSIINFYVSTILFTKRVDVLIKIFGISALIQIALTYWLVNDYGLNGAIYAGLLTKALQVVLSVLFTKPIFDYQFNYFKIMIVPLLYFVLNIIQFLVFPTYSIWLYLLQLLIFSGLFYALFRNEIKKVLETYKLI